MSTDVRLQIRGGLRLKLLPPFFNPKNPGRPSPKTSTPTL